MMMARLEKLREQLDGLEDGDGHFEVVGSGPEARLRYHVELPHDRRVLEFIEPLAVINQHIESANLRKSAAGAGVTPLSLFTVHAWESALTAKCGEALMALDTGGVRTLKADSNHRGD